ncbi:MAG: hypothetical protein ACI9MR_003997 [Myxococcota bacterium]
MIATLALASLFAAAPSCDNGAQDAIPVRVGKTVASVCISPGLRLTDDAVVRWVRDGLWATHRYFTAIGVPAVKIDITATAATGVGYGTTWSGRLPTLDIRVGRGADKSDLDRDWVLVHELVHIATPRVGDHKWWREGIATYVEPFARYAAGKLTETQLWRGFHQNMRHGQPRAGDRGIDRTGSWGRVYWGGALWALVADVEIRRQTGNRKGLRDALVAMTHADGSIAVQWTLHEALAIGDNAIGKPVLSTLYQRWKHAPVTVDLDALWRDLGVVRIPNGALGLSDNIRDAKDAAIRRAMTRQAVETR